MVAETSAEGLPGYCKQLVFGLDTNAAMHNDFRWCHCIYCDCLENITAVRFHWILLFSTCSLYSLSKTLSGQIDSPLEEYSQLMCECFSNKLSTCPAGLFVSGACMGRFFLALSARISTDHWQYLSFSVPRVSASLQFRAYFSCPSLTTER